MTDRKTSYHWARKGDDSAYAGGWKPCDILTQHWGDTDFRTILLTEEDFKSITPWKLVSMLTDAYEVGRREYQEELQRFLGIK